MKWTTAGGQWRKQRRALRYWYKESVLYPCQTSALSAMKCWPQYGCCNILPLTCMSCLIIGLGPELTACTVKRWFTVSSSFKRWTRSAANFLLSTQKKRGKRQKRKIKKKGRGAKYWENTRQFCLSLKIYSGLWEKKRPLRELGKERTHPPL